MRPGQRPVAEGTRLTITEQLELFQRSDDTGGARTSAVGDCRRRWRLPLPPR